jgi:Zn-dependent protease
MFDRGFWQIGRLWGAPLRVHWSTAIGALLFGGLRLAPAFWVGFFALVLVHELGHALLVRRYRHTVLSIDVTGFGGVCRWSGPASDLERAKIAWGGVLAQALLLGAAALLLLLVGAPQSLVGAQLAAVFIDTNLLILALNLIPFRPLDGAEAWTLFSHLRARSRGRRILSELGVSGRGARVPRRSRRRVSSPPDRGVEEPTPAARTGAPSSRRDLAEFLRQVGDEAGRARRDGQGKPDS